MFIIDVTFWSIAYLGCIYVGFKHKNCAMPILALLINYAWELAAVFHVYFENGNFENLSLGHLVWLGLNTLILITWIKYGNFYTMPKISNIKRYALATIIFAADMLVQIIALRYFTWTGFVFVAFAQNLMMSFMFLKMFERHKDFQHHNFFIAVGKCIGTISATTGVKQPIIIILGILCALVDIYYIWKLYQLYVSNKKKALSPQRKVRKK